jgi:sugar lactone lactonase YvrE
LLWGEILIYCFNLDKYYRFFQYLIMMILTIHLFGCGNKLSYELGPLAILPYVNKGVVSTIAGNQSWSLNTPGGAVYDKAGNLFVAEIGNHVIRKFASNGAISVFAGQVGVSGSTNGTGTNALFYWPSAIAIDSNQNLYVADQGNNLIRKITPTGVVSTFAGSTSGFTNANGILAQFNLPNGVAVDDSDNIFVADFSNHAIRKITPSGDVTTFAGGTQGSTDGVGTAAKFYKPTAVAFDTLGNLFVTDSWNCSIRKITTDGTVTTFAGGSYGNVNGVGTAAKFNWPYALSIDSSNNIYVADPEIHAIRQISSSAVVTTFAGGTQGYTNATGTSAQFNTPFGIAVDRLDNIIVLDSYNNSIRKISSLAEVTSLYDNTSRDKDGTGRFAQFAYPTSLTSDRDGNIYIVDQNNYRIRKMSPSGVVTTLAGSTSGNVDGVGTAAKFAGLSGITIDQLSNLYVTDTTNNNIRKITPDGTVTTLAGGTQGSADGTGSSAQFYSPRGIIADSENNLYVADALNHSIRKVTSGGVVTTIAGGTTGTADGIGTAAQFALPYGITIDTSGNLFVVDFSSSTIRKISPTAVVTTFAGSGATGNLDGVGTSAQFYLPTNIAIDVNNNLYLADMFNNSIRKITKTGVVTTFAGSTAGFTDGTGTSAQFYYPQGVVIAPNGYIYISDSPNHAIRMIK